MNRELTFLGKSGSFGKRNTSSYTFIKDWLLLIDCGYTVFPQLQEQNLLEEISGIDVFITHMHADHVGSLSQLALYSYIALRAPLNIITACVEIDTFLTITGVDRNTSIPAFPKERYTRTNNFVTLIPTEHVEDKMDSYGFSAMINGTPIVYTGDTKTLKSFLPYLKKGSQLYTEASVSGRVHLKLEDNLPLLKELTKKGIAVYLMHLDDELRIRKMIKGTSIHICDD